MWAWGVAWPVCFRPSNRPLPLAWPKANRPCQPPKPTYTIDFGVWPTHPQYLNIGANLKKLFVCVPDFLEACSELKVHALHFLTDSRDDEDNEENDDEEVDEDQDGRQDPVGHAK